MRLGPFLGQGDPDHPVTINELKRLPALRIGNWSKVMAVFGGVEFIFTLPGCWVPFIHWLWRLPALLVSSNVISREVENRTWHPLIATPLTLREIIHAKYTAIFRYVEQQLQIVVYVRAIPVLVITAAWFVSTITVLPQRGVLYWVETTLAVVASALYVLVSPLLDVAVDAAMGILASTLTHRRPTASIMALLARTSGWMLPLALAAPLQYGLFNSVLFGMAQPNVITLRAIAIVATFGPAYAFPWGITPWISVGLVITVFLMRVGLVRLMLELAVVRAGRIEL